jgi:hypothetical protein
MICAPVSFMSLPFFSVVNSNRCFTKKNRYRLLGLITDFVFFLSAVNLGHYQPCCLVADKYYYEDKNKANKVVNG